MPSSSTRPRLAAHRTHACGHLATFSLPPPRVTQYYHLDALGSVRAVMSEEGTLVRRHDYGAFGEDLSEEELTPLPADAKQQRFTGKERDAETQLDYFGARYYRTMWGRFATVDPVLNVKAPLIDPQRWNRYTYGLNNPFVHIDPDGAAIELLGGAEDRDKELELLGQSIGQLGVRLYINQIDDNGRTRYFVGIRGDVGDFARAGGAAQNLANLVVHRSVVEFGLTSQNLEHWEGAATFEPGEAGNQNTRILVNPGQMAMLNSRLSPNTILGASRFEGEGAWRINPFNAEIAAWHEFGHAWRIINGRSMPRTNAEALGWENQMRAHFYGPLGPFNARRIRH